MSQTFKFKGNQLLAYHSPCSSCKGNSIINYDLWSQNLWNLNTITSGDILLAQLFIFFFHLKNINLCYFLPKMYLIHHCFRFCFYILNFYCDVLSWLFKNCSIKNLVLLWKMPKLSLSQCSCDLVDVQRIGFK